MLSLLHLLRSRFDSQMHLHPVLHWAPVEARLLERPDKLLCLQAMEDTGGAPDVVGLDKTTGEYLFYDCSPESPAGRRSLCYDPPALESRKEHKPRQSALGMALEMGIELLTEAEYLFLQQLGPFDTKTSSWLYTPAAFRQLGGALFGDRRYGRAFIYHNGAESYYAARGFRGRIRV